jgi:hypothetical protein
MALSERTRRRRLLEANLDALERAGCGFWACPGPTKRWQAMHTCVVCHQIRETRKELARDEPSR